MISEILTVIALLIIILGVAVLVSIASIWIIVELTGAQEVTCNWIQSIPGATHPAGIICEFKNTIREINQTCYHNGELVNCSGFPANFRIPKETVNTPGLPSPFNCQLKGT